MKRIFDFVVSLLGLIILSPLFLFIAIIIKLDSKGPVFYKQLRTGKNFQDFYLYKFRSMKVDSHSKGSITIGKRDPRVTNAGYYLRKFKLDELPQLINVLKGEMSFVGPRPELKEYVELYDAEQKKVLSVKPGITDYASIKFRNENELLAQSDNPKDFYVKEVMPAKLKLNIDYVNKNNFFSDIKIIFITVFSIFRK